MISGLTCRELVHLVTAYLEGALPRAERLRFEAHLATCHGCTTYLEQLRETIRLVGALTEDAIAGPARATLLEAFRDWKQGAPRQDGP